jgi:hypothetical protein
MKFGFVIPTRPPLATTENIVAMLAKAEELGFGYVTVPDHIIPPGEFNRAYPYAASGEMSWGPSGNVLEMLALLSFLAAKTSSIRIATGIMVVPLRNPLFAAKALATIDFLSNDGANPQERSGLARACANGRHLAADQDIPGYRSGNPGRGFVFDGLSGKNSFELNDRIMSVVIEFVMAGSGPATRNPVTQPPTFWAADEDVGCPALGRA